MFDFPNPSKYLDNPRGYGDGVYLGSKIQGNERLWRAAFQWLSRTKAVPKYGYDITLPEYQVQHYLAASALASAGRRAVASKASQLGIVTPVEPTNYQFHKGTYYVLFEPTNTFISTGLTPADLRERVMAQVGTPEYIEMVRTFSEQLDPELMAQYEREARETARAAREAEEAAFGAARSAAYASRRAAGEYERAAAWEARQRREAERRAKAAAERAEAEARAFVSERARALVNAIRSNLRGGFGPRITDRTEIISRNDAVIVALPREPMVMSAMPGVLLSFQQLGKNYGYEVKQGALNVIVFSRTGARA